MYRNNHRVISLHLRNFNQAVANILRFQDRVVGIAQAGKSTHQKQVSYPLQLRVAGKIKQFYFPEFILVQVNAV